MKLTFEKNTSQKMKSGCIVIFADPKGNPVSGSKKCTKELLPFVENGEFGKTFGSSLYFPHLTSRTLFINMGEKKASPKSIRVASAKAWKFLRARNLKKMAVDCQGLDDDSVRAVLEGAILASYQYLDFKTDKNHPPSLSELLLYLKGTDVSPKMAKKWAAICKGVDLARDLMLAPPNVIYPESLAQKALELEKDGCFKATILDQTEIKKENMNALLSVSQGSQKEPRFIIMEYAPEEARKTYVLVGKAVTFDSGGLSLKPSSSLAEMKGDMGGGATVFGIMSVLKKTGCPHRVIGLVPSVENMPSGSATRPSDVVTSRSGITIEINNTDAEGRLILADALDFAKTFSPNYVIDYATLTGACMVALGPKICGIMGNNQKLVDAMVKNGYQLDEPFWQLPLEEDYEKLLKSDTADISNISSSRWGGAITAGLFLQRFAKDFKWAHCDIAASILEKEEDFHPKGGSGAGIRTTLEVMDLL